MSSTRHNEISGEIVDAAVRVHIELGPGLLESAYEACLSLELQEKGLTVKSQVELPIVYRGTGLMQVTAWTCL